MSSAIVVGSLFANLGLNTADFQAGLDLADRDAKKFAKDTQAGMKGMAAGIAASAGTARAALTGMVSGMGAAIAGIGLAGLVAAVKNTAAEMATLSDEAKQAGLSLQSFQEWTFVAEQNRIGIDAMVDGFKELSLRADEFATTGKGSAAEAFQRLGYGAEDLKTKLQDPSALMLEIIDRVGQLDKAAQIRVFDELLGGSGGEQFVRLIDQGAAGLRTTIDRAHELGRVLDDDVIASQVEINKRFSEIAATVDTHLKWAIVEAGNALEGFLDMLKKPADQELSTIRDRLKEIERITAATGAQQILNEAMYGGKNLPWLKQEREELEMILKLREQSQAIQFGGNLSAPWSPIDTGGTTGKGTERADRETEMLQQRLDRLRQALMTEEEAERFSFDTRMNDLRTYLDNRLITEAEYDELSLKAREEMSTRLAESAARQAEMQSSIMVQSWEYTADMMGSLSQLAAQFGEEGFLAAKALGIGQAVVNTAIGVTEALKQPFPLNFAVAASVAAAGAAQIATIASAQPGNAKRPSFNGGVGATVGGGPAVQKPGDDNALPNTAYVNIAPSRLGYTQDEVREILEVAVQLQKDGFKLVVAN